MTKAQVTSVLVFTGVVLTCGIGLIVYDVWLAANGPDKASTISWSMSLLGHYYPIVAFAWGLVVGVFGIGLAAHFWFPLDSPGDWDELVQSRWQLAQLKAQGIVVPTPPADLDYN